MTCDNEILLISRTDFDCIGQVARHCDWDQLCIYIREQQNLSLLPKIGQCLYNIVYCKETDSECEVEMDEETYNSIMCGGQYVGCDGKTKVHFGLKRVLVHYAYGAYIYRHGYVDTPFGVVQKINQDSISAPIGELKTLNNEHRKSAEMYWQMTSDFLCSIKDNEAYADCVRCCDCKCGHCSGKSKTMQNRNFSFKNVSKW